MRRDLERIYKQRSREIFEEDLYKKRNQERFEQRWCKKQIEKFWRKRDLKRIYKKRSAERFEEDLYKKQIEKTRWQRNLNGIDTKGKQKNLDGREIWIALMQKNIQEKFGVKKIWKKFVSSVTGWKSAYKKAFVKGR